MSAKIISKLYVNILRFPHLPVRYAGNLKTLEGYEKLRMLCCTSAKSKAQKEYMDKLRPQIKTKDPCKSTNQDANENTPSIMPEIMSIRTKTAMIIGGASGIGFETADTLLKAYAEKIIIADACQTEGIDAAKKLCAKHGSNKVVFLSCDVKEKPSIEMAFREINNRFKLDIFINATGVYNETPQCWDQMVRANLIACIRSTLLAYKYMSKQPPDECHDKVILNVSSYGSIANVPSMPLYSAATNGINGLTTSFGQDFHYKESKIRYLTVCPSCTDTELFKNMTKYHYDPSWAGFSNSAIKCCVKQTSKFVGKAIVNAIRFGENGSVFVVKEGKYYKYLMPDYEKIMRQETVLL